MAGSPAAAGQFNTADGLSLSYQAWRPEQEPRAVFAIVHGYGDHSGRYGNLVNYFVPRGIAVYGFDLRGHGQSPGQRGHIRAFDDYIGDVRAFVRLVRDREPGHKLFLVGHSMGGLISLRFAQRFPDGLDSLIITGPLLQFAFTPPGWKVWLGQTLSKILPAFTQKNGLDAGGLSRDPAVAAAYRTDPLVHDVATARWYTETTAAMQAALAAAPDLKVPLLLMHGGADPIAAAAGSRRFFERMTVADRQLKVYQGSYHELYNETNKGEVLRDVEEWVEARI